MSADFTTLSICLAFGIGIVVLRGGFVGWSLHLRFYPGFHKSTIVWEMVKILFRAKLRKIVAGFTLCASGALCAYYLIGYPLVMVLLCLLAAAVYTVHLT